MPNIIDILARALSLRQETALNSITPNRAGGIMYDTLLVLNQMQLEGGSLLISKVYASVSAMEADTTPTSDLTGRALKPGQLVVIVTSDTSSSDMGSEYRYNGPGSWTYVGKVGGLPLDTVPTQSSTKGITSGGVYAALSAMKAEGYKYMGIATPGSGGTAPGTPNQPVFYIAGPGSYPNFGSITVASGYLGFIKYSSGSWSVESVAVGKDYDEQISTLDGQISQLEAKVDELEDATDNTLVHNRNYADYASVLNGLYPTTAGKILENENSTSIKFPCKPSTTYTFSKIATNRFRICYFNTEPVVNAIGGGVITDNTATSITITTASDSIYIVAYVNDASGTGSKSINEILASLQIEEGSTATEYVAPGWSAVDIKARNDIAELAENVGNLAHETESLSVDVGDLKKKADYFTIKKSPNLINPDDVVSGYLGVNGQDYESDTYVRTQNYIKITAGEQYKLLEETVTSHSFRRVVFYDADKVKVDDVDSVTSFTAPAGTVYVRLSWSASHGKNLGLFDSQETQYTPYYDTMASSRVGDFSNLPEDAICLKKDITPIANRVSIIEQKINGGGIISFVKNGVSLTFNAGDNNIRASLDRHSSNYYGGNHPFNFVGWTYNGDGSDFFDNVAPMHICGTTIGANHGWPMMVVTITAHGLGNADVGGEFTQNGKKFYLLRVVDANTIWLISENIGTSAKPQRNTLETGAISYNGNTYTIGTTDSGQTYPSLSNVSKVILLDGQTEISEDGTYPCSFVDIVEEYDVMSIDSIVSNLIANYGNTEPPVYEGTAIVHIRNTYRILANTENFTVLVFETISTLIEIAFDNYMFTQEAFHENPDTLKWYLPNSKQGDNNFVTPALWDVVNSVFVNEDYFADANNPVNRVLSFSSDVCFAIGFVKEIGVGKVLKDLTSTTFELRGGGSGKIYPHGVDKNVSGNSFGPTDIYTGVLYKCYSEKLTGDRISFYHFPVNGKEYVYVDYSASCVDKVYIGADFNGKSVSVVESRNAQVKSDVYNNGIDIVANYVNGETCYIVLAIG